MEDYFDRRLQFCEAKTIFYVQNPNFVTNVLFNDEATFFLNREIHTYVLHALSIKNVWIMGVKTPIVPEDFARQACSAKVNNFPYKIGKTTLKNLRCGLLTPGVNSYELQLDVYGLDLMFLIMSAPNIFLSTLTFAPFSNQMVAFQRIPNLTGPLASMTSRCNENKEQNCWKNRCCHGDRNQSDSLMAADGDCHHLCKLMAPVRHRWSINDVIGGIRNTVMPSDGSPQLQMTIASDVRPAMIVVNKPQLKIRNPGPEMTQSARELNFHPDGEGSIPGSMIMNKYYGDSCWKDKGKQKNNEKTPRNFGFVQYKSHIRVNVHESVSQTVSTIHHSASQP
ncbi:hypothetical protein ANN_10061 [Periplaneta americana]|uniref:Uncharacterized protein n=1 Tax=Periplaneta americana TaxID=6978 RepID=A0ABQ8TNC8_PERAM|nr:hypothetical protein ANN_10061 [Periplaneta americana]